MDPPLIEKQHASNVPNLGLSLDQLRSAGKTDQGGGEAGHTGAAAPKASSSLHTANASAMAPQVEKAHTAMTDCSCWFVILQRL